ncbi:MAG TPA: 2-oxo-tetronate isomerase [Burkholderiales bacterium]|nr:2-oxo-tetronate isomerase [Burkholderiales bacterium]
MPKLAANLSMLFPQLEFLDRFAAAAKAGFRAVEYQYPYDWQPADLAAAARDARVEVLLHNMPQGDAQRGERGTACLTGREQRFRDDLERAIEYARVARCPNLHLMAGVVPEGADRAALHATYVSNLKQAARRLAREGMRALIEPLSERTVANCFLRSSAQAARVLDDVAADNVLIQYDFFHMQIMEGNLASTVERLLTRIGHIQLADVPGRHEPGTGEINFDFLLRRLDALGYSGWVGCEYNPEGDTLEGLTWARPYLQTG